MRSKTFILYYNFSILEIFGCPRQNFAGVNHNSHTHECVLQSPLLGGTSLQYTAVPTCSIQQCEPAVLSSSTLQYTAVLFLLVNYNLKLLSPNKQCLYNSLNIGPSTSFFNLVSSTSAQKLNKAYLSLTYVSEQMS